jgi:predicted AAA+ superfamily ATPase
LQWFEDAYFLFSVRLFANSVSRQNVNPRKIYCVDHALAGSVSPSISADQGHLLESLVFIHVRRRTERIWYYRTASGQEVDLIWEDEGKARLAVQVSASLADSHTRSREVTALKEALRELGLPSGTLVTLEEEGLIEEDGLRIEVVPAWRFLLNLDSQEAVSK